MYYHFFFIFCLFGTCKGIWFNSTYLPCSPIFKLIYPVFEADRICFGPSEFPSNDCPLNLGILTGPPATTLGPYGRLNSQYSLLLTQRHGHGLNKSPLLPRVLAHLSASLIWL